MTTESKIEVGAADGGMRLWVAKEALRHAELRLAAQTANLAAMEARVVAMLGWISAMALAVTGGLLSKPALVLWPTALILFSLMVAAGCCIRAIWPRIWHSAGVDLEWLLAEGQAASEATELSTTEAMVDTYLLAVTRNADRLKAFGWNLRAAWLALLGVPVAAVIVWAGAFLRSV